MDSRCTFIDFQQITSPAVRDFARYWQSKTTDAAPPRRSAIDPLEIPHLLPFLVIVQIEALPLRVRYRLVGTRVAESHGADFTNRYLDECGFLIEEFLTDCYRRVAEERAPHYMYFEWMRTDWAHDRGRIGACESGFFPLSSDGVAADMAITIEDPKVAPRRLTDPL
jgi:hypothetical protein